MISKLRRRMNFVSEEDGFTLIELMVVIAVLGILAGIAIPKLGGVKDKAKEAEIFSLAGSVRNGMEMYKAKNDGYPAASNDIGGIETELNTVGMGDVVNQLYNSDAVKGSDANEKKGNISYDANNSDSDENPDQYYIEITSISDTNYYIGEKGVDTDSSKATDMSVTGG